MHVQKKLISIIASTVLPTLLITDAGAQGLDELSDAGRPGHYAVGHVNYTLCCTNYGRQVAVSVFYPVDRDTIKATTPQAQYQLDPFSTRLPITTSAQWEAVGLARAYEGPKPSDDGPFPLVIVTPAFGTDHWTYIFLGTSLASHGYVAALTDHPDEGQWPWSNVNDTMVTLFNRTHDLPFVISQLLERNSDPQELLHGTLDAEKIVMSGHSIGGNATYALAAGYNDFCDELFAPTFFGDPVPEPSYICVPLPRDHRINAIITIDGVSMTMRYPNLAKIEVPSLILAQTVENLLSQLPFFDVSTWAYRAHAAIDRPDSYRVEIQGANHYSFSNYCQAGPLFLQLGVLQVLYEGGFLPGNTLAAWNSVYPCAGPPAFDPVTIDPATAQRIVNTYVLAFLNTYIRQDPGQERVLTSQFAREHEPLVYFYNSEECKAELPSKQYYTYHPIPGQCAVAQKDPPEFFAP